MIDKDKYIIDTLTDLVNGKLSEDDWYDWFEFNRESVADICGRTAFLKIKPSQNFSRTRGIYISQFAAYEWLVKHNISVELDHKYEKAYHKEFSDFCKQERDKERKIQEKLRNSFEYLEKIYPKLFKQLIKSFTTSDEIENSITKEHIKKIEHDLSITLPESLVAFFLNISKLHMEGIYLDFNEIKLTTIKDQTFLILGEFWFYGDGNLLLFELKSECIFVSSDPEVIKQTNDLYEFIEKNLVKYIKSTN